jgi:hypothetical protein
MSDKASRYSLLFICVNVLAVAAFARLEARVRDFSICLAPVLTCKTERSRLPARRSSENANFAGQFGGLGFIHDQAGSNLDPHG